MKLYFRILSYGRPWLNNGIFAFISLVFYNVFSVISLTMIIPFLQILFEDSSPLEPQNAIDWLSPASIKEHFYYFIGSEVAESGKFQVLIWFCIILGIAIFLKNVFRYLSAYNIAPLEQGTIQNMRKRLFSHLSRLSMNFYTGERKGKVINILITDVQVIQESVIGTLQSIIKDPITMVLYLFSMLFISWKLTLFTLIILPVTAIALNFIGKSLKQKARLGQESLGRLISVLDEFVSGIRIVKAFQTEAYEEKKYHTENAGYKEMMVSVRRRSDLASPLTEVFSIFIVITILLFGGNMILNGTGELRAGEFIGFIAFFSQFLMPIKTFAGAISKIQRGVASFIRVEEFLAIPETVKEKENCVSIKSFEDEIRYENVSFAYEEEAVLKDISLSIKRGKMIALIGPSGGGKSTLADLLPRFYDPIKGKITIDGIPLTEYCVEDLRALFGVVTQEGILFNESILHNIAYGDSNPDLSKVVEAAKVANADEFIMNLPEKYETFIGERGTKLSGGQRQRIAIARAIYKNPPVLILDEATSALDTESEKLVQSALDNLMQGRTSLVIAHRLSTIQAADCIYVIENGMLVEQGTHGELLVKEGTYHKLHTLQFK